MPMKLSKKHAAIIAILIANIIWGAAPPIFKWSLVSVGPMTLGFLRFFIGTLLLLPLTATNLHIKQKDILRLILAGFFSVFLNIAFYYVGLGYAPSINVTIIGAAGPIFILVASGHFFHERVSAKIMYGTLISLAGVLIIIFRPMFESGINGSIVGNFLYLLSTLASLPYFFVMKGIIDDYSPIKLTFWIFFFGQLFFLPAFLWEANQAGYIFAFNMQSAIGIFYGAVLSSTVAWLFQAFALKYLLASEVTIFTYLDPVFTALVAVSLLGEVITFSYILGSALVFGGIFFAEGRFRQHKPIHRHRIRGL